jgi:hypothetical protein
MPKSLDPNANLSGTHQRDLKGRVVRPRTIHSRCREYTMVFCIMPYLVVLSIWNSLILFMTVDSKDNYVIQNKMKAKTI